MTQEVVVYYDYEPAIGVNATCEDWPDRNEYFKSWSEFKDYLYIEYGGCYKLVEITADNYLALCEQGIFNADA